MARVRRCVAQDRIFSDCGLRKKKKWHKKKRKDIPKRSVSIRLLCQKNRLCLGFERVWRKLEWEATQKTCYARGKKRNGAKGFWSCDAQEEKG